MLSTNVVERTLIYLQGKLQEEGFADAETKQKAIEKKIVYVEDSVYLNAIVRAGQTDTIELTDDTVDAQIGITNLDKGKLPKFGYAAFTDIILRYGGLDTADDVTTLGIARKRKNYNECLYDMAGTLRLSADFLQANLEIVDGNNNVIFRRVLRDMLLNGRESYKNNESKVELRIPRIFKAEEKLKFQIVMPKGVAAPGTVGEPGTGQVHYFQVYIPTIQTKATV